MNLYILLLSWSIILTIRQLVSDEQIIDKFGIIYKSFIRFVRMRWIITLVLGFILFLMITIIRIPKFDYKPIYLSKLATKTIPTTTKQFDNISYLISSENCLIPYINPHDEQLKILFKKIPYQSCTTHSITILKSDEEGNGILTFNETVKDKLLSEGFNVTCCYSIIRNHNEAKHFDIKILISDCITFDAPVKLNPDEEFIATKCELQDESRKTTVYKNAHTNIQIEKEVEKRLTTLNENNIVKPWNVLVLGIDTMSRVNLARAMPKTNAFLKNNNWLDFQGYNKIGDNTYPNLMAMLTGRNLTQAIDVCDGQGVNSPDNCDFMWKRYQEVGYVTAYGEDSITMDTFGKPQHAGFTRRPTDHYLRPLFKSSEIRLNNPNSVYLYCTGQTTSAELLFDYSIEFIKKYKDHPYFGFFWSNTFSHEDLSSPSHMDEKIEKVLEDLKFSGGLETTIVFFISDHGLRFGKSRYLLSGYYEERLPVFFAWLPPKFIETFPNLHKNMLENTKRLTNPYDVYMTLEDILKISEKKKYPASSAGCPECKSLFKPISKSRTCEDSYITPHWCTCDPLKILSTNHTIGKRAVDYVIDVEIETILSTVNIDSCRICARFKLDKIFYMYTYENLRAAGDESKDYLVIFSVTPSDIVYEATVRYFKNTDRFQVLGKISMLTAYKNNGECVNTDYLRYYCYCIKKICYPPPHYQPKPDVLMPIEFNRSNDMESIKSHHVQFPDTFHFNILGVIIFIIVLITIKYMIIEENIIKYKRLINTT